MESWSVVDCFVYLLGGIHWAFLGDDMNRLAVFVFWALVCVNVGAAPECGVAEVKLMIGAAAALDQKIRAMDFDGFESAAASWRDSAASEDISYSDLKSSYWEWVRKVDALNGKLVEEVLTRCDWPSGKKFGGEFIDSFMLLIQHGGANLRAHVSGYVEQAFERGEIQGAQYAKFIDRALRDAGKKQRYGTQLRLIEDAKGGRTVQWSVEDESRLEELRKSVGLNKICDYFLSLPYASEIYKSRCTGSGGFISGG